MKRIVYSSQEYNNSLLKHYEALYKKSPTSKIFAPLADNYRKRGNIDMALRLCLDGVKIHPTYSSGRLVLAKCYFDKRMYKKAIYELEKVLKANPTNIMAQTYLGKAYLGAQEYESALESFNKAKNLSPQNKTFDKIINKIEIKVKPIFLPIQRRTNQNSLDELSKKSLFYVEQDQFVIRPISKIFDKKQNLSPALSLSPSKENEISRQSLRKLFLTQGLTRKASSIEAIEPFKNFQPKEIQEKFISPDKELIANNTIIKKENISVYKPNLNPIIELSYSIIPSTIKNKIKNEMDEFPELPEDNLNYNNDKNILKTFDGYNPESTITKQSVHGKPDQNQIIKSGKENTINKLSTFLNRIQERAY